MQQRRRRSYDMVALALVPLLLVVWTELNEPGVAQDAADPKNTVESVHVGSGKSASIPVELPGTWLFSKDKSELIGFTKERPRLEGAGHFSMLTFESAPSNETIVKRLERAVTILKQSKDDKASLLIDSFKDLLDCGTVTVTKSDGATATRYYALLIYEGNHVISLVKAEGTIDLELAYLGFIRDSSGSGDMLSIGGDEASDQYCILVRKQ